ncbi:GNAT family N-acetyltransferase [Saccharomonospora xinjiangensis]|uniref:GNAT family N-acetyltransferase n=1 Tax=Saccharomonospora xinjiangensis TaxID=75294 RepID=UPI0010C3085D|nr:GNAT family N-acetyltransferase [Saccharomonospora xinjiangensis]QBQ62460.1 Acetyltransferase (GNAT) family protein [Saccharomonospora xinjiangensis]
MQASIGYVQDVLVHPDCQRHGVGRTLVTTLLDLYLGVRQRVLLTDAEPGQRAFYESLGFTEIHDMRPPLRSFVSFG